MGETNEEARRRYELKNRKFAELKLSGDWPSKSCHREVCKAGGCCVSFTHHVGDCCLHCGNDERAVPSPPATLPTKNIYFAQLSPDVPVYLVGKPGSQCYVAGDGKDAAVVNWDGWNSAYVQGVLNLRVKKTSEGARTTRRTCPRCQELLDPGVLSHYCRGA